MRFQRVHPSFIFLYMVTICLSILSTKGICRAELPKHIREQLHKNIKYEVLTERNLDAINKYQPGKKPVDFVVVQAKPEAFKENHAKALLSWVESGGVLWFHDSRLAEYFGMQNSPLSKDKIKGEPYKGGYGTGTVDGMNVVASAIPFSDTSVANGVQSIQVFLMEVGKDKYSAVSSTTKGVIPVFAVNIEPKCVVALRKMGKGWIIFKPLLWPEVLGGERFQANLMEFSAGYPVPKTEQSIIPTDFNQGKPIKLPRIDSLILSNGEQWTGYVMDKSFSFAVGGESNVEKKVDEIRSIVINQMMAVVTTKDGKEYRGVPLFLNIEIKSISGKKMKIEKDKLQSIQFDVGQK